MSEGYKILFISQSCIPERVGGATHNFEMAEKLSERGHQIDFITMQPSYPFGEFKNVALKKVDNINDNLKIIRLLGFKPHKNNPNKYERFLYLFTFSLSSLVFTLKNFKLRKYDIVITSIPNEPILISGLLAKKIFKTKWIIDIRDLWFENAIELKMLNEKSLFSKIYARFREYCFKNATGMTYTAETIIKELLKSGYHLPKKRCFNPNGFEPHKYPVLSDRENNVIYLGNVGLAYDVELVIDAIPYSKNNSWKLIVRGGGDKITEIKKRVKNLNLEERVVFFPPLKREELLKLIAKSKIGVCPLKYKKSLSSVIPTKIIEYFGCGIPIVTSGPGEIEKITRESRGGIHIQGESKKYAEAIDLLFENKTLYQNMSKNAFNYVNRHFNKQKIINNLDCFLRETMVKK